MIEFMQDKIGQVYKGAITGLTEWGMYVELDDLHIEGMISFREIRGDYFEFNPDSYTLRSRSTGHIYRLGDPVTVKVTRANLEQKQLDYSLVQ
jgi:ribonuclease R